MPTVRLPPSVFRELGARLQELEAVTNQANREVEAARREAPEGGGLKLAENLLDRGLASIEHLREVAETMTRRPDDLLDAQSPPFVQNCGWL